MVAGGHCAFNPEPLADFVDAFVMGDGEEVVGEITEVVGRWLAEPPGDRRPARTCSRRWPRCEGVYVPALYVPRYEGGRLVATEPVGRTAPGRGGEADGRRPGRLALPPAASWCR